jgi:hypothetical protein
VDETRGKAFTIVTKTSEMNRSTLTLDCSHSLPEVKDITKPRSNKVMPSVLLEGIMYYIIALFTHYAKAAQEKMVFEYHNTLREFIQGENYVEFTRLASVLTWFLMLTMQDFDSTRYTKVTMYGYLGRMNNNYDRLDGKMFDDGPISMAAKSKDPSQAARLAYDSNHYTTHYDDASNWRFPELSTACSETQ